MTTHVPNKKPHSILIEIWQNVGNNDNGSTTANSWKLISSKWQNKSWSKPLSDHQLYGFSNE